MLAATRWYWTTLGLRAASSGLDIFCNINTGSVALISGVIGTLVTLIALAFSVGPLGHAERYLPANQPEHADTS